MNLKRAEKLLTGCTVRRDGREVQVNGNNLGYRIGVTRNGQVRRDEVDYVKSKMPTTTIGPR